jgi:hypothetical protein
MHHPEDGTAMQTVLEVNLVAMSIKLFIVLSSSERAKHLKMVRQQLIKNWMSNAKNSLVQKAQYADIPAQAWRRKVVV